jgi:DNA replication protein DnaC
MSGTPVPVGWASRHSARAGTPDNLRMHTLCRPQLLILDERGYFALDKRAAQFLFQLVSRRYQRASILLTSNKSFNEWGNIFPDPVLASALLDRLHPR